MTHDPLCPYRPVKWHGWMQRDDEIPCRCGFIAKVRADERNRCIAEIEALGPLQQFKKWTAEDGSPIWGHETIDVSEALRREPSWKVTHHIATGPVRRITP